MATPTIATPRPLMDVWREFNNSVITGIWEIVERGNISQELFYYDNPELAFKLIRELVISAAFEGRRGFQIGSLGMSANRALVFDSVTEVSKCHVKVIFGRGSWCEIGGACAICHEWPELYELVQQINIFPEQYFPAEVQEKMLKRVAPTPVTPPAAPIVLSDEQQKVVNVILEAANSGRGGFYFVTGKAGTGKSTVNREIQSQLKGQCVVTAPTGIAAVNVQGQTIHSFFSLPRDITQMRKKDRLKPNQIDVVKKAKIIFIDEISMVRADVLDAINIRLQTSLENDEPFGGKLIIACGDIWQLDPVLVTKEAEVFSTFGYQSKFWFDAEVFSINTLFPCGIKAFELTTVFRQAGDDSFLNALNAARKGNSSGLPLFNTRVDKTPDEDAIKITFTNKKADVINADHLRKIEAEEREFVADVDGQWTEHPAEVNLKLKVGSRVMVLRNIKDSQGDLVANGSVGKITYIGETTISVTLDDDRFLEVARESWEKLEYGIGLGGEISGNITGTFTQYPLRLAYAITAHKSQGQTYEKCHLQLESPSFSHGQTYVALSRCKSLAGLSMGRNLKFTDLVVDPRVREWDEDVFGVGV